jgi:isoleucyl-tRNA synthetase
VEFVSGDSGLVSYQIKPNFPRLGKRYGKLMPAIKQALAEADSAWVAAEVTAGRSFSLDIEGQEVRFEPEDCQVQSNAAEGYACAGGDGFMVALDTTLHDDLVLEGLAREIVRSVQDARKSAGLDVSDRIRLGIGGSPLVKQAIATHADYIRAETLAVSLSPPDDVTGGFEAEKSLGEEQWKIRLIKS